MREGPSEATFSRAFKKLAEADRPARRPAGRIKEGEADQLVGHLLRETPALEAREQPAPQEKVVRPKHQRGRPRQGEERPKERSRLERPRTMNLEERAGEVAEAVHGGGPAQGEGI